MSEFTTPASLLPTLFAISRHCYNRAHAVGGEAQWSRPAPASRERMLPTMFDNALRDVRDFIHADNRSRGWWTDLTTGEPKARDPRELRMLIITELAEAMEGFRKSTMDDHLSDRPMLEVELADTAIRIFDAMGGFSWQAGTRHGLFLHRHSWAVPSTLLAICELVACADYEPETRLTNALFWLFVLGEDQGLDVPGAIVAKLEYNAKRADHKLEARMAEGGKKL